MSTEAVETDVETVVHWGVRRPDGGVTWDPSYGAGPGYHIPLTESEARALARRDGGEVVTRTETTVIVTTPWVRAAG